MYNSHTKCVFSFFFIPTNMVNLEQRAYPDTQRDISRGPEEISTPYFGAVYKPEISENYSSPLERDVMRPIWPSRRTLCATMTTLVISEAPRRSLITRFSEHYTYVSAIYLATSNNFVGDTLPRASAPRDNPRRKSAKEFRLVFDLCKSNGCMYLCALILNVRRARDEPPKRPIDPSERW